ncbi:LysM peptidoglycan-binding domain-containing protein [Phocicoccus pinnipedialis]|uniref:Cell wall-binding protein YocH n=1 Tax=Phocicoccus pinnipedialis TaxID=110845 RepID=A0A6V7R466_9BACL|nr:LysM peptidoglycan-binding domain-containing protein [Jeotgalicoccus pinnipedialis]MBP1939926.1 peptidoglycan endopeptidase LytE [Jeotgalicoccus pinnipedialis]CAD2072126.1 Cell wall-binding protein YocH precursor [Jeotgalicoccus pinnipedialis]
MKKSIISLGAVALVSGAIMANDEIAEAATHKVKSGDTLSAIAVDYNTTVKALKKENKLSSDLILTGQELKIDEVEVKEETKTHKVKSGDTVAKIANKYEVNVSDVVAWNDLESADLIFVGQVLNVSKPEGFVVKASETNQAPAQQAPAQNVSNNNNYSQPTQQQKQPVQQAPAQNVSNNNNNYSQPVQQKQPSQPAQQAQQPSNGGLNWSGLAACESGGNPSIVSANGMYHGLYQFDVQTWRSVGGSGLPSNASAAEQTKRAQMLYNQRGSSPWPVCGARL